MSLDPCRLVTSAEASSLANATFGKGAEERNGGGARCVYGSQTPNVFTVEVAKAKDAATARADWSRAKSQAQALVKKQVPPGVRIKLATKNVGVGDRAATIFGRETILGRTFGFSGIYVLKGATFFAFQDLLLSQAPPTAARMEAQARTVLGRVS